MAASFAPADQAPEGPGGPAACPRDSDVHVHVLAYIIQYGYTYVSCTCLTMLALYYDIVSFVIK